MATTETTPLLREQEGDDPEEAPSQSSGTFAKRLGTLDGFVLLISIIVGSGVFSSPGPVDANVPSPLAALAVWFIGGIVAWTGALTMAELGTAIPGEGGIQPYLTRIYGEFFGYLAAWSWIVVTMPATLAILSIVFAESIFSAFDVKATTSTIWLKLLAMGFLLLISFLNCIGTKWSALLQRFSVGVKGLSIGLLLVAGLTVVFVYNVFNGEDLGGHDWHSKSWFAARDTLLPDGKRRHWGDVNWWDMLGFLSTALYGALWAYSGWDKANYVAAELRDPSKQLPRSVNFAIPTVIGCYVAANAVYYVLLPWTVIPITDAAAVAAVSNFLGLGVGKFAMVLICLVIAGSALGNSFVAGRMTVAAANKKWFPEVLGTTGQFWHWRAPSSGTSAETADQSGDHVESAAGTENDSPINAILLNAVLGFVYIFFGNMRLLLTLNGLSEYAFFFLTVVGAIILRKREPELHRPIKVWIIAPVIFAIISFCVVVRGAIFEPVLAAILGALWAVGVLAWCYAR